MTDPFCGYGPRCPSGKGFSPAESGDKFLCPTCLSQATDDVASLRMDYVELTLRIGGGDTPIGERVSGPAPASRPPLLIGAYTLRSVMALRVRDAEDTIRDEAGIWPRSHIGVPEGPGLEKGLRVVVAYIDTLAAVRRVPDWLEAPATTGLAMLDGLRAVHRRCVRMFGAEPTRTLPGYCPACHVPTLARTNDPNTIACHACGHRMTQDEYQHSITLNVTKISTATVTDP